MSVGFNANVSGVSTVGFSDNLQGTQGSQGVFCGHKISSGGDEVVSASDLQSSNFDSIPKRLSEYSVSVIHNS